MLRHALRSGARGFASSAKTPPSEARVVVIGGGIIGNSVAYHLAHAGLKDVVLLERDRLTSGTTWHAAGLMVTFGSKSETSTEIRKYSKQLYSSLEKETGQATGFMDVGFIEVATSKDGAEEYRRIAAFNRKCGVDVKEITPSEIQGLFPLAKVDDIHSGFYVESDGRVNPVDASMALAKGARMQGATIVEGVSVDRVTDDGFKVTGVVTDCGQTIKAEVVVNCGGMWAPQLAAKSRVALPNQAAEHYYLITEAMPGLVDPRWPVLEDPSSFAYIRPEGGGLMVGLFEGKGKAWNVPQVPKDFSFGEIEPDWDRLAPYLERAMARVPKTLEVGAKKFFCGPESFTPDGGPLVGEVPELKNYFVAAGLNSIGILSGPGVGRLLAHWIKTGLPDMDVTQMNVDRFQRFQCTPAFRSARCEETLGNVYKTHYPHKPAKTARGAKRTPLYASLAAKGAAFRDVSGWECADWFSPTEAGRRVEPLSWGRHHWFETWAAEHRACREGCGLFDMSFMSKFRVQGPDAGRLLDWLSTSRVDEGVEPGTITYTQWLNRDGKLEADLTITKPPNWRSEGFLVVATDTAHRHVETRLRRYIAGLGDDASKGPFSATVTDVTSALALITVQGPRSREVLQAAVNDLGGGSGDGDDDKGGGEGDGGGEGEVAMLHDCRDAAFPFRAAQELSIGLAPVLATRITYVGELGFELLVDAAQAATVHDTLVAAAAKHALPLTHCGLKALGSLRMEKGYRDFGHDMDNCDALPEVGLGFTADWGKPGGFVGAEALRPLKDGGVKALQRRLVQVRLDDPEPLLFGGEVLYLDGAVVGDVRAASYGHSLGGAVGLAMAERGGGGALTKKRVEEGQWEVDVNGVRYAATASLKPLFDPSNAKIKA